MLEALEHALSHGQRASDERLRGQSSLFAETEEKLEHPPIGSEEFEKDELLRLEKEALGLYVSEHPLEAIRDQLRRKTDATLAELERRRDGEIVTVGGIVSALKQLTTKKGDPMVFMRLDDVLGSAEVVVFNSVYAASRELLATDSVLVVKARVDHKQEGETKLIALEVTRLRGDPGAARGSAEDRRAGRQPRADPRAGRRPARLPRRAAGRGRPDRLGRDGRLRVRPGLPRQAGARLLRRGQGPARRSRDRLTRKNAAVSASAPGMPMPAKSAMLEPSASCAGRAGSPSPTSVRFRP